MIYIEKLGTNAGPKLARLRVPQRPKPNRFSAFKSGNNYSQLEIIFIRQEELFSPNHKTF